MYASCFVVLCLAVFAAPALGSCVSALPGPTCSFQTPVIQNPTKLFPGNIPNGAVTAAQHCFRTLTRPQLRNEIITVPSVDRIVRYVPGPVEAVSVNYGFSSRGGVLPTAVTAAGYGGIGAGYGSIIGGGCGGLIGGGYRGLINRGCGGVIGTGCGGVIAGGCGGVIV